MRTTIREMEWEELVKTWKKRNNKPFLDKWGLGKFFEYAIIRAFEIEGAQVRYPYEVNSRHMCNVRNTVIEQIDGVIYVDGLCVIAESKDFTRSKVDIEPLAKLQIRLKRRPSLVIGCLFCASDFTWPAQALIESLMPHTILLWNKSDIEHCFKNRCFISGLQLKYKSVIEDGNHILDLSTYAQITNEKQI